MTSYLNTVHLKSSRSLLLGLLITNMVLYVILIPLSLFAEPWSAVISVPVILVYYIIETSCFFGCQAYNWPCTLTFRIIWALHDFSYFITYAVNAAYYGYYKDNYYHNIYYQYFVYDVCCCVFFFATFGIGIAIMCTFSVFPNPCNTVTPGQIVVPVQQVQSQPVVFVQNPNPLYGYNHQPVQYVTRTPVQPIVFQNQQPVSRVTMLPVA